MPLTFWSNFLHLPRAEITGVCHQAWFIQCGDLCCPFSLFSPLNMPTYSLETICLFLCPANPHSVSNIISVTSLSGGFLWPSQGLIFLPLCTFLFLLVMSAWSYSDVLMELDFPIILPSLTILYYPEDANHCFYCRRNSWHVSGPQGELIVLFMICLFA